MCLNSHICGIHSLGRYSREVFIGTPPPIAPQKWALGKGRANRSCPLGVYSPLILAVLSATGGDGSCSRLIAVTANSSLINC